ncbi:anti-sigma factor [Sulfitobacter sp. D35]|uniref:anti-sigma factor n=1 Tax=Sulfitobacter sp. D35 TaxID=3083252 RepID=UPI00296E72EA|nr:anti-sigma factor [Sulfitobacter sp. D35]MDW4499534.1 anti-sigma factor [Sulfitobacter sp. D35]
MTDTPDTPEDFDGLAAEYALGLTPPNELAEVRDRTFYQPDFADAVAAWHERLAAMTDDIGPVKPPRRVKRAIATRLFGGGRVPVFSRAGLWQGVSLAALALAAFLGWQTLQPPGSVPLFATQIAGDEVTVLAVYDPVRDGLALNRIAGDARPGRVLEVWAIAPDAAPVSLGLLPEDGMIHVPFPDDLKPIASQLTLAVSDEPPGGSPTGAPTGDVLAAGEVSEL